MAKKPSKPKGEDKASPPELRDIIETMLKAPRPTSKKPRSGGDAQD